MKCIDQKLQNQLVNIWKEFCSLHNDLFEATCEEYQLLLDSKMDLLEEKLKEKVDILNSIRALEVERQDIINSLNKELDDENKINNVSSLLTYMNESSKVAPNYKKFLSNYNSLLIDIVEKIQEQNRKNQSFLNKAIHNLRDIREGVEGKKVMVTYGPKGKEIRSREIR